MKIEAKQINEWVKKPTIMLSNMDGMKKKSLMRIG